MTRSALRHHDGSSPRLFVFESACVLTAYGLVLFHFGRALQHSSFGNWTILFAILLGWVAADFMSGCVHWLADTWGSETMPWIGPRFLKPFRVHHVTPGSFLECSFMDTNGDTALIGIPFLLSIFLVPIASPVGFWCTIFMIIFCVCALPTNQIHQWAHMPRPPRFVRWLQRMRVILASDEHRRHHSGSHNGHYCITTGFCNPILERLGFFRRLEHSVTRWTGFQPRYEELSQNQDEGQTSI